MKIREDSHGLYVRTNGGVYRPVPAKGLIGFDPLNLLIRLPSKYKAGEDVPVRHISQSVLAKVGEEHWWVHGDNASFDTGRYKLVDTNTVWNPDPKLKLGK